LLGQYVNRRMGSRVEWVDRVVKEKEIGRMV
jgi:hypothetical protein